MLERKKQFNSSLHNVSKKRLEQIKSGNFITKPKTQLRQVSKKTASLWADARKKCLERYGNKCFLCGATGEIHIHHFLYTRTQRPDLKYNQDNLIPLCPRCHNHTSADKRFYELKALIHNKKARLEDEEINELY